MVKKKFQLSDASKKELVAFLEHHAPKAGWAEDEVAERVQAILIAAGVIRREQKFMDKAAGPSAKMERKEEIPW